MPSFGHWRGKKTNMSRMSLAQLVESQRQDASPLAKLTAANKAALSRSARVKRKGQAQLLDLSQHGTVLGTGLPSELAVATRWVGQDFIITRARYLQPWRLWPADGVGLTRFRSDWREGTRVMSRGALMRIGFDFRGGNETLFHLPLLAHCLESVGIIRIVPKNGGRFFENDSLIHWGHHVRDGMYDVWAGYKLDKNGDQIWLGQDADNDQAEGFIPCHYNQIKADGNGIAMVYRFKQAFVEALPHLLPTGS